VNRRAALIITLALGVLVTPLVGEAELAANVPRIGILWLNPLSGTSHLVEAFRQGLRELGYVEGQNIAIEFRSSEGKVEELPGLAAELVRLRVDVIVTGTSQMVRASQQATRTIPIVMGVGHDPVGQGFVASLARPGGNITGLSIQGPDIAGKRLELLKEIVPKLSRVAVLWDGDDSGAALISNEIDVAARAVGVQARSLPLRSASMNLESAFREATNGRVGALVAVESPLTFRHRTRIADLAARSRLPLVSGLRDYADAGGLLAYGASLPDLFRRAATFVDKILKGAKPADLPVQQPTKFELVINLKTAKGLGLTIPPSVLLRADHVIQ
jgi:putative tryptophan/tyrosine transport system substrate-binding protein